MSERTTFAFSRANACAIASPMPPRRPAPVTRATFPESPASIRSFPGSRAQPECHHRAERAPRHGLRRAAEHELKEAREAERSHHDHIRLPCLLVVEDGSRSIVGDRHGRLVRNLAEILRSESLEPFLPRLFRAGDAHRLLGRK